MLSEKTRKTGKPFDADSAGRLLVCEGYRTDVGGIGRGAAGPGPPCRGAEQQQRSRTDPRTASFFFRP